MNAVSPIYYIARLYCLYYYCPDYWATCILLSNFQGTQFFTIHNWSFLLL